MTDSRQHGVHASIIATLIPSSLILSLRFYARHLKGARIWWDDYLAVASLVAAVAYNISAFFRTGGPHHSSINKHTLVSKVESTNVSGTVITKGLGLHLDNLPVPVDEARFYQAKVQEIEEHFYTVAIGAAQLSLLALYWRLFKSLSNARTAIFVLTGCVAVWIIVRLFVAAFQCSPPRYFWDKSIEGQCTVDSAKFASGTVSTHLLIDFALMVLPATQFSRLMLPCPQKKAIAAMSMIGIGVVVASIMVLATSSKCDSSSTDAMWDCTPPVVWSAVEIHFSVMACCLPVMQPVADALGSWWGQNFPFTFRKGASTPSHQSVKLGQVHRSRSTEQTDGESTCNLAAATVSNTTTTVELGRGYGRAGESDTTIVSSSKAKDKSGADGGDLERAASMVDKDRSILVQYEVNLSFSRNESCDNR